MQNYESSTLYIDDTINDYVSCTLHYSLYMRLCVLYFRRETNAGENMYFANILPPAEIGDYSSISTLVAYGMSINDLLSTLLTMRVTVSTKCNC